ncbi:GNAT family N-acetyltransferase [Polymorphospora sp. NPDC050346]|uniref:GNAT family N-acetyltransferase n=1 Tax=Polymorphospora sp. NPDC050346 TaxID=3155780 RepID=UPI0033CF87FC
MTRTGEPLAGRAEVLAAAGDHTYVRLTTAGDPAGGGVTGFRLGTDTVVWFGAGPGGPVGYALGDGVRAARFFASTGSDGPVPRPRHLHLPDVPTPVLAPHLAFTRIGRWLFLDTAAPPSACPGEDAVVPLTAADHDAIDELLDDVLPDSTTRPGDARVAGWYGIRAGGRLVACGADRSRGDVGFLASLAVARDAQGRGLGGALTTALTRRLVDRYGRASLGVYVENVGAIRLYRRLGYTGALPRTSLSL